jgi:hypothetical protein
MKATAEDRKHAAEFLRKILKPTTSESRCKVCGKSGPEHGHYDVTDPSTHKYEVEWCGKPEIGMVYMGGSRSGMQRRYMVMAASDDKIERISWAVAAVTGMRFNRDEQSIVINGCGFSATLEICAAVNAALAINCTYRDL